MNQDAKITVYLQHILESIQIVERYIDGVSKDEFLQSLEKQDAIIRRIEIMGEAVKNLPRELRNQHPEVPWVTIAGTRDVLIHQYFDVDLEMTWEIVQINLPELKRQIRIILDQMA